MGHYGNEWVNKVFAVTSRPVFVFPSQVLDSHRRTPVHQILANRFGTGPPQDVVAVLIRAQRRTLVPFLFYPCRRRPGVPALPTAQGNKATRRPVSRVLYPRSKRAMAIHLGRPLPDASRDRPGRRRGNTPAGAGRPAVPTWSCSRWGLPCRPRYRGRGALLPHPFTLAGRSEDPGRRFAFCGTVPGVAPAGRYPAPCFRGARTFLPRRANHPPKAAIRPSGMAKGSGNRPPVKGHPVDAHRPSRSTRPESRRTVAKSMRPVTRSGRKWR